MVTGLLWWSVARRQLVEGLGGLQLVESRRFSGDFSEGLKRVHSEASWTTIQALARRLAEQLDASGPGHQAMLPELGRSLVPAAAKYWSRYGGVKDIYFEKLNLDGQPPKPGENGQDYYDIYILTAISMDHRAELWGAATEQLQASPNESLRQLAPRAAAFSRQTEVPSR